MYPLAIDLMMKLPITESISHLIKGKRKGMGMSTRFMNIVRAGAAAIAAVAAATLLLGSTASAVESDSGASSGTGGGVSLANLDTTKATRLIINKYGGAGCTGSTNGTGLVVDDTEDSSGIDTSKCTALKGVKFKISPVLHNGTKINLATKAGWDLVNAQSESAMLKNDGSWNTANTGGYTLGTGATVTTDETGAAIFAKDAGDFSLYYVEETYSPVQTTGFIRPFLVTMPYPSSGTGDWLYNVNVYPKNDTTGNTLQKTAVAETGSNVFMDSATSTNRGQQFWIKLPLPNTTGNYTTVWVQDQLQNYFGVAATAEDSGIVNPVYVAVYFSDAQPADGATVVEDTNYTVTYTGGTKDATNATFVWGPNIKITLGSAALTAAKGQKNMWIRLSTRIDASKITNGKTGVLANNVSSDVKDDQDNDTPGNPDPDPTNPDNPNPTPDSENPNNGVSKWGTVNIRKYEGAAGAAYDSTHVLKDAEFTVFLPSGATTANLTDAQCTADGALDSATAKKTYTTGSNGEVAVKAFVSNSKDVDTAKYCVLETKAPTGFQTPAASTAKAVTFTADGSTTSTVNLDVPNQKTDITNLVKLPLTGAAGMVLMTVAGAALVAGAVFMLVAARRRREAENME